MRYQIDVHRYPETFEVIADSESKAKEKARQLFYEKSNNGSVYELEVTGIED